MTTLVGTRIGGALVVVFALGGLAWALAGGPILLLWCAAGCGLLMLASRWYGLAFSLAGAVLGFLALELLLLVASAALGNDALPWELVVWTVVGCGTGLAALLWPTRSAWPRRRTLLALAASLGSAVTLVGFTLAAVLPRSSHIAWAMNEDGGHDILTARGFLDAGGIAIGSGAPSPLPIGMLASALAPGRDAVHGSARLLFDISRLAELWVVVIALTCLLLGAAIAHVVARARLGIALGAVAVASLAGGCWWVVGIPLAGGFINAGFATLVILATWIAFLEGASHPRASLVAQGVAIVVILSCWSPLVACAAALALVTAGGMLLRRFGRRGVLVGAAVLVVLVVVGAVLESSFIGHAMETFRVEGGFPDLAAPPVLLIASVFVVILAIEAFGLRQYLLASGAVAVLLAVAGVFALMLYARRDRALLIGYYPLKLSWLASILVIVMLASLVAQSFGQRATTSPRAAPVAAILGAALAIVAVLLIGIPQSSPIAAILGGRFHSVGNAESDRVLLLAGEHAPWASIPNGNRQDSWVQYYLYVLAGDGARPTASP